jgi:hypothetical protein
MRPRSLMAIANSVEVVPDGRHFAAATRVVRLAAGGLTVVLGLSASRQWLAVLTWGPDGS